MTRKDAYCKIALRHKEMTNSEWSNFVDLIKHDLGEFARQFRAWEKRHNS